MTESNLKYIQNVKVEDIPWHRLTTAYKRATDFPKYFDILFKMRSICGQRFMMRKRMK